MVTADKVLIEKLNQLIDDHLDESSFTVETICEKLGVSRSHLHRTLKAQTDLSISLYIRKRRLRRASHLLTTTDLRISEIGDLVGFTNPQNFSTYFIDEFKISPSEFRKQLSQPTSKIEVFSPTLPLPDVAPLPNVVDDSVSVNSSTPILKRKRNVVIYGSLVAMLLVIIAVGWYVWSYKSVSERSTQSASQSLVILPFLNLGDTNSNPACEGIMDDVHTSISTIKNLKVIARSSSDKYKDAKKTIWQIGDELQADNVLKGSVLKTRDQIQVKLDLISTKNDIRLWTKKYNTAYKDIFNLTDQIVRDVVQQLKVPSATSASEKLAFARTKNLDAYNLLLQGKQLQVSRMDEDLTKSISRLDQALALDSSFAELYAQKAVAYHLLMGSTKIDAQTSNRMTEENALKAIRLDPTNSTAYAVLGSLYYSTYQWQASENAFRIALQNNPNDAQAYHWYGLLMRTTGRLQEAIHYSSQAVSLDPLHPIFMAVYIINCSLAGQFDLAREGIEKGLGLFDKSFSFQSALAYYWMCQANYGKAVAAYRQAQIENPDDKGQTPILLYCEAKNGNRPKAIQFLQELKAPTARSHYERAVVFAGLNQADSSMYYLKKAADGGYLYRDTKVMPPFKPYHSHPLFKAVMRQFKLPE
ncbi:hypothetical protein GCM10028807_00070 [Spirosoma daeguense]